MSNKKKENICVKKPKVNSAVDGSNGLIVEPLPDIIDPEKYGTPDFYEGWLDDEKTFSRLVKKIEIIIRKSPELKYYIQYLKDELDMSKCYFYKNLNSENVSIELHHYPFTLFDIVETLTTKAIKNNENYEFSTFVIAEEAISLHYRNIIGLVPLSITLHQLAHSGNIYIPMKAVFGDVKIFLSEYKEYIKGDLIQKLEQILTTPLNEVQRLNFKLNEKIEYKYQKDHELMNKEFLQLLENNPK